MFLASHLTFYTQVCKFLEVSRLSFAREYGSKMKEGYVTVKHLREVPGSDGGRCCLPSQCLGCFGNSWAKVCVLNFLNFYFLNK